jgi:hypothetical protein
MKIMFLDESGDHNLATDKIDATYPIFVLAGCIFDERYYKDVVVPGLDAIKVKFFDDANIILHTAEMIRPTRSNEKRFRRLVNAKFRENFYGEINRFLEEIDFYVVACLIKKRDHSEKYGLAALDPYLLSFDNLLNRFIFQLTSPEQGAIIAEKRNGILDNQLDIAWLNVKVSGTSLVKSAEIKEKISDFKIVAKAKNETGLQIADLIVSPIGRKTLGIKAKPGNEIDFEIINKKFIKKNGKIENCGLTILPHKT